MTTTPATRPKLVAPDGETTQAPLNLQQRILKITAEVAVKATGKTAQGQRTMSIADVEESLADLCVKYGVVTDYAWNNDTKILDTQGNVKLWLADITIRLVNADDPSDRREARSIDVGTSPSAAVSFALKRFYRALFHLADEEDETRTTGSGKPPASNPKAASHLTAEQVAELQALNKECKAPVPDGLAWDSLVAGRSFEWIKSALLARKKKEEPDADE